MVGWHHQLNGHEFEQTPRDGEEQGSLVCCSLWGHKESDTTERLKNNKACEFSGSCFYGKGNVCSMLFLQLLLTLSVVSVHRKIYF